MNEHTNRKVICVKDIPSNLIEEAIFILKSDDENKKNKQTKESRKQIILNETENFMKKYEDEFSKLQIERKDIESAKKEFLLKTVLCAVLVTLTCYFVSLVL